MVDLDKLAAVVERRTHLKYAHYFEYEEDRDLLLDSVPSLIAELHAAREELAELRRYKERRELERCETCGHDLYVSKLTRCPVCCPMDDDEEAMAADWTPRKEPRQ
jgi:hypothetical protein